MPGLGQLPRGTLESPLRDLATTLDFGQPVASLQVCSPQMACVPSALLACLKSANAKSAGALSGPASIRCQQWPAVDRYLSLGRRQRCGTWPRWRA